MNQGDMYDTILVQDKTTVSFAKVNSLQNQSANNSSVNRYLIEQRADGENRLSLKPLVFLGENNQTFASTSLDNMTVDVLSAKFLSEKKNVLAELPKFKSVDMTQASERDQAYSTQMTQRVEEPVVPTIFTSPRHTEIGIGT